MHIRISKVGGWTFYFDVPRRKLVLVEGYSVAWGDYWQSLTGALGLVFGIGDGGGRAYS